MKNKYLTFLFFCLTLSFNGVAQCLEDPHTPFGEDSWISCEISVNPNADRPASHWILYDLGYEYVLDSTYIWNLNVWTKTEAGVQELAIDYSLDGDSWQSLDNFIVEQASGSYKYEGTPGPSFDNVVARYVLLTAVSNWGDPSCTGLSEIRFGVGVFTDVDPEPELANQYMVVSPNPVVDLVNVSIKSDELPERVALYDLSGKLIEEQNTILSKNVAFNMKGLPGGIYFVKATVGEELLTEKVVKVGF